MTTDNDSTDDTADADLRALANEIASTSDVSQASALMLARLERPALRQYVGRWNARVRRARAAQRSTTLLNVDELPGGEE